MKIIFGTTNKRKIEDLQNIINEMNIKIETKGILGTICRNWWWNEEEKQEYARLIKEKDNDNNISVFQFEVVGDLLDLEIINYINNNINCINKIYNVKKIP